VWARAIWIAVTSGTVLLGALVSDARPVPAATSVPSGTVAYVVGSASESWVETRDLATGRTRRLTRAFPGGDWLRFLEWSSTGRRLSFRRFGTAPSVYTVRSDGGELRAWFVRETEVSAWSPSMKALALVPTWARRYPPRDDCRARRLRSAIEVVDARGRSRLVEVRRAPTRETLEEVAWASTGESMLVVMATWQPGYGEECDWATTRLIDVDLAGGRTVLAEGPGIYSPRSSPDGRMVAAYSDPRRRELFVVGVDGRGKRSIERNVVDFAWTTDSTGLVLLESDAVSVRSVTRARARTLVHGRPNEFESGSIADVSRDWVALPRSSSEYELVSLSGAPARHVRLDAGRTGASSLTLR